MKTRRLFSLLVLLPIVCVSVKAQSFSPLFAPASNNGGVAYCRYANGTPVPYCYMTLYTGVYLFTNGHFHDDPSHPWSSVYPTSGTSDGSGYLPITISTTLIGQAEAVVVCDVYAGLCNNLNFGVGYGDLFFIYYPDRMILVGGNTTLHGDNSWDHWMISSAGIGIANAAADYINTYNPGGTICTNDEALPYGGKFDKNRTWRSPHIEHDRGTAVDLGINFGSQCPDASVITNPEEMVRFCKLEGANIIHSFVEYGVDVHCNWADPATYPH